MVKQRPGRQPYSNRRVGELAAIAGTASAVAGALTVSGASVVFFLLPIALPIGFAQMLGGVRLLSGSRGRATFVILGGLLAVPLSMSLFGGFAAPIAFAATAASLVAIISSVAYLVTEEVSR
jgi:hypothetical protein